MKIYKNKYEGEYTHSTLAEAEKKKVFDHLTVKDQEHHSEIERLLAEISRLHDEMEQTETLKEIEINALRNRYENEAMNQIQNLKRSQYGNTELQELNIRKLKDTIEEKNFEIENLRRQAKLENERLDGEISYFKNEIKKTEHQKEYEINLLKTENENAKNNMVRTHRKNEEELSNLHEAKVRRLTYEVEEKRHQIE